MIRVEKVKQGIRDARHELAHLGACTTAGKTDSEIAHIDERFFLACEKLEALKAGLKRSKTKEWKSDEACL